MPDTRRDPRAAVSVKMRFKSATIEDFVEHYSGDISRGGLFIRTKEPMEVGTLLKFEFQLRDQTPVIHGVGRVVWRREFTGDNGLPAGMGIKFIKMGAKSRELVDHIVKNRGELPAQYERGTPRRDQERETIRPPVGEERPAPTGVFRASRRKATTQEGDGVQAPAEPSKQGAPDDDVTRAVPHSTLLKELGLDARAAAIDESGVTDEFLTEALRDSEAGREATRVLQSTAAPAEQAPAAAPFKEASVSAAQSGIEQPATEQPVEAEQPATDTGPSSGATLAADDKGGAAASEPLEPNQNAALDDRPTQRLEPTQPHKRAPVLAEAAPALQPAPILSTPPPPRFKLFSVAAAVAALGLVSYVVFSQVLAPAGGSRPTAHQERTPAPEPASGAAEMAADTAHEPVPDKPAQPSAPQPVPSCRFICGAVCARWTKSTPSPKDTV